MKKSAIFFLTLGIASILIGGIGSVFYFQKIENTTFKTSKDEYIIKNKQSLEEVQLTLSGNQPVYITSEGTEKIKTEATTSTTLNSIKLEVSEKDNLLNATLTSSETPPSNIGLNLFFLFGQEPTKVTLPEGIKKLTITGNSTGSIYVNKLITENLEITLNQANLTLEALETENLTAKTTYGSLNAFNVSTKNNSNYTTTNGSIGVENSESSNWTVTSKYGYVSLNSLIGNIQINATNGFVEAYDIENQLFVKNTYGSFSLYGSKTPEKLTAATKHGSIYIELDHPLNDILLTAQTNFGTATIYDEETNSYQQGEQKSLFELSSKYGNISVN